MATETGAHTFPCPSCGAEMDFDAAQGTLTCGYCGRTSSVPVTQEEIQEYDLEAALKAMLEAPHEMGYGGEKRSIRCESCGAVNTLDAHVLSTECAFCGSNQVIPLEQVAQVVKPESLLPFLVAQDKAASLFREWLGRGFFRPNPVKKIAREAEARLNGVYLPFWTFDAVTSSWWQAEAGYYYYREEDFWGTDDKGRRVKRTRRVRDVRWQPASGNLQLSFNDVLVPASSNVGWDMLQRIYPFDTDSLVPYDAKFLSGWGAEAYTVDLRDAWSTGKGTIQQQVNHACARQVPGDTHRNLRVDTAFSNLTYKHVLFPVWIASYRFRNKVYHFLVNGQTGEVQGQAPVSWIKVTLVVILVTALVALAIWLISMSEAGAAQRLLQSALA